VNLNVSEIVDRDSNHVEGARAIIGTTTRRLPISRAIPPTNKSPSFSSEGPSSDALYVRALKTPQGIPHPIDCHAYSNSIYYMNIAIIA
jgi:hypothetical protein